MTNDTNQSVAVQACQEKREYSSPGIHIFPFPCFYYFGTWVGVFFAEQ
jgi:hypothetical protein